MNDLMKNRGEFARAIRNGKYERADNGIFLPSARLFIGAAYDVEHRRGGDLLSRELAPNIVPTEGLNHILSVILNAGSQVTQWYLAPFEGNYTPVAGVTAATFTAAATESTAYDESTRVAFSEGAPAAGVINNSASRAEFTFNASKTIYGCALLSASAKSATTGTALSVTRFPTSKAVADDDVLAVRFDLTLTSS